MRQLRSLIIFCTKKIINIFEALEEKSQDFRLIDVLQQIQRKPKQCEMPEMQQGGGGENDRKIYL